MSNFALLAASGGAYLAAGRSIAGSARGVTTVAGPGFGDDTGNGSGAGCGNHWPLCNGDVVPRAPRLETIIELKQGFPNLVVFAMSASGARKGHDFLSIAAKFGADGILQKPFSPDELLALIASRSTLTRSAGLAPLVGR